MAWTATIPVKGGGNELTPPTTQLTRRLAYSDWPTFTLHNAQPCDIMQSNLVHPEAEILFVHQRPTA